MLHCVELTHKLAPISIREKVALNTSQTYELLSSLASSYEECFVLSTCNRLAIYCKGDTSAHAIDFFSQNAIESQYLNVLSGNEKVVENLFNTAAGLESQAIGEHQILWQIKTSYEIARKAGTIGPVMDQMIRTAIHAGKKVRHFTSIGKYSTSLATVAFELIQKHGYHLPESTILLIGTGNMANLVATILDRSRVKQLYIASHEAERAKEMAAAWGGIALPLHEIDHIFSQVNIVIGGSHGEINLLSEKSLPHSRCKRSELIVKNGPKKLFIDFGVPRNFSPSLKLHPAIYLYDLDDIKKLTYEGLLKRYEDIPQAISIVKELMNEFLQWLEDRKAAPLIDLHTQLSESIANRELSWLIPKLGHLSESQKKIIQKYTHRLLRSLNKTSFEVYKQLSQASENFSTLQKTLEQRMEKEKYKGLKIRVGTRGSLLALAQTRQVVHTLQALFPDICFEIKVIKTHGDEGNLHTVGAFTSKLQEALIQKKIDIAIHSAKDLPIEETPGLKIAAFPTRQVPNDVLFTHRHCSFHELPIGSHVGTGSLRRTIQLKILRPDLQICFIQGNINTRLEKLKQNKYDAIILAYAGIKRLYPDMAPDHVFPLHEMLPAAGQGALAIEIREEDTIISEIVSKINDPDTQIAVQTERIFLKTLGGGCNYPIAVYSKVINDHIEIHGFYAEPSGKIYATEKQTGPLSIAYEIAKVMAQSLKKKVDELKAESIESFN